jgi:hypothetical protein
MSIGKLLDVFQPLILPSICLLQTMKSDFPKWILNYETEDRRPVETRVIVFAAFWNAFVKYFFFFLNPI